MDWVCSIQSLKVTAMLRASNGVATVVGIVASIAVASCAPPASVQLPPSPPIVHVALRDYWFDFNANAIPRGRVVFQITNAGKQYHQLALVPLPPDFPSLKQQLAGTDRRVVSELVSSPPLQPGASDTFAANLAPGRWGFVDFFIGPEGSHAAKGDAAEFVVR